LKDFIEVDHIFFFGRWRGAGGPAEYAGCFDAEKKFQSKFLSFVILAVFGYG